MSLHLHLHKLIEYFVKEDLVNVMYSPVRNRRGGGNKRGVGKKSQSK